MQWLELGLAAATAAVGALGGLGGAVLLVPLLVLIGVPPLDAAPLGLVSVAAGSVAAGAVQLTQHVVNHRLGVVLEVAASAGAVTGALVSAQVPETWLLRVLAAVALVAAVAGGRRSGLRNRPDPALGAHDVGEWPGTLAGAYPLAGTVVPYRARRVPAGLALMGGAGLVAGVAGVGGGFLKTPAMSELMHVPVRVAAATSTFTVGVTASAGLVVFALQGRIDVPAAAAVTAGSVIGGRAGATVQGRLSPALVRRVLSGLLVVVAAVLVARSLP